jgi:hypothetical protein
MSNLGFKFDRRRENQSKFMLLTVVASYNAFLVLALAFASRPTADEYLTSALLKGFYVDAPNSQLFSPSNKVIEDISSSAYAAFQLGWDAPLNFILFQMIPGTVFNYYGPIAFSGLSLFYSSIATLMIYCAVSTLTKDRFLRKLVTALVFGALYTTLIFARFPGKDEFGIFTATGIRFGLYWIHPTITVCLFIYIMHKLIQKEKLELKHYLLFLLVPNLVSIWSISVWIALLFISSIYFAAFRRSKAMTFCMIKGLSLSLLASIPLSLQILKPTIVAGRFIGETLGGSSNLNWLLEVKNYLVAVPSSYMNFWGSQTSAPIILGILLGLVLQSTFIKTSSLDMSSKGGELLQTLLFTLSINVLITPLYFNMLETYSYSAWWHRTTPNTFFFFSSLFITISWTRRIYKTKKGLIIKKLATLTTGVIVFLGIDNFQNSVKTIFQFKESWDSGNVLGESFPIENRSVYNIQEILKISPYNFPHVNLKNLMIKSIPFLTEINKTGDLRIVSVQVSDSVFKKELNGEIEINVLFSADEIGDESNFLFDLNNSKIYPIKLDVSGMAMANVRVKIGESNSFKVTVGR